jgi:hypothetical protein
MADQAEQYVLPTPPSTAVMQAQEQENRRLLAIHDEARLLRLTPRACVREAAVAAAALYDIALGAGHARGDLLKLMRRPNMARGVGLLLAFVVACLLLVDTMLWHRPTTGP